MKLTLTRNPVQPAPYCTMGELQVGDRHKFYTVERPWVPVIGNYACGHQETSCIGKGQYTLEARETEARGKHWIVSNPELGIYRYPEQIPHGLYARSLILIHAANWAHELQGCIAPGKDHGMIGEEWGVAQSRGAMFELRAMLVDKDLHLEIQ